MKVVLFPDTNLFLQCNDVQQLDWERFGFEEIDLVIARVTREEIQRLKGDGNGRRAKRARKATSLFREVLRATDESFVLRPSAPRVVVSLARSLPQNRSPRTSLDLTLPDHRLIEEALFQRDVRNDPDVRVLSDDTDVLWCARDHRLPFIEIPENWLLEAESDQKDKQIRALSEQVKVYQRSEPQLALGFQRGGQVIEKIEARIATFSTLSSAELDGLEAQILCVHPQAENLEREPQKREIGSLVRSVLQRWEPPTPAAISAYQGQYLQWRTNIRSQFESLLRRLNARARVIPFQFTLSNEGARPAERLLVEIKAHDGLLLQFAENRTLKALIIGVEQLSEEVLLAPPPRPPSGNYVSAVLDGHIFQGLRTEPHAPTIDSAALSPRIVNQVRDRHHFYPRRGSDGFTSECALECEDMRHGGEPELFQLCIIVPHDKQIERSHLSCRVSAANLSQAVEMSLGVSLSYRPEAIQPIAQKWRIASSPNA